MTRSSNAVTTNDDELEFTDREFVAMVAMYREHGRWVTARHVCITESERLSLPSLYIALSVLSERGYVVYRYDEDRGQRVFGLTMLGFAAYKIEAEKRPELPPVHWLPRLINYLTLWR